MDHMIEGGFSNSEISRALKLDIKTVRKWRGNKNVQGEINTTNNKSIKGDRNGNTDSNDNRDQDRGEGAVSESENTNASREEKTGGGIEFIGGNKNMPKKEENNDVGSEAESEKGICGKCGGAVSRSDTICPHCGVEFEEDQ